MGVGASTQSNGKHAKGNAEILRAKWDASSNCRALEDEICWLKGKIEQEKREKEWLMTTTGKLVTPFHETSEQNEQLSWLRKALDAEKHEKEWLMARYERLENDLQVATDECILLRSQTAGFTGVTVPEAFSAVTENMPRQSIAKFVAKEEQKKTSLKERRGLALGVDTSKKGINAPVSDVSAQQVVVNDGKTDPIPLQASNIPDGSCLQEVTTVLSEPALHAENTFDRLNNDSNQPLIKHRSSEPFHMPSATSHKEGMRVTLGLRRAKTVSLSMKDLNVQPLKMQTVDCPSSPKRKLLTKGASFEDGT